MFDPTSDLWPLVQSVAQALLSEGMSGTVRVAVALILVVALARKALAPRFAFLRSDLGAVSLTVGMGLTCGVANALVAGSAMSWGLLWAAFGVSVQAAGGYSVIKKALLPLLEKLSGYPYIGPVAKFLALVLAGSLAVKKAEAAGQAAVDAKPSTGVAGVVGAPKDIP